MIRFINPNYHVILIHFPIALLGLGIALEILGYIWETGSLRPAGRWMALIGALACAPAATSGLFAKYDIIQQLAGGAQGTWSEVRGAANLTALQWRFLNLHVLCASIGAAAAVVGAMAWLGGAAHWPRAMGLPLLVIFAAAMGLMGFGAYNAGEMVYRTQFATQSQAQSDQLLADWNRQTAAVKGADKIERQIEFYIDTMQAHVIAAGCVFALAAAGIGLSMQKSAQIRQSIPADQTTPPAAAPPPAAAGRFWLLTALGAVATAALGWYVLVHDSPGPLWDVRGAFESQIMAPYRHDHAAGARPLVHLYLGATILVLALFLIPAVKWGAGSRLVMGILSLLMVAAVAGQIWIGVLMMYDTDSGPLTRFNAPAAALTP